MEPTAVPDVSSRGRALIERTMASRIDAIDAVVVDVVAACRAAGVDDKACRFTVPLVLTEILANAIESGNGGDATRSVRLVVRESALGLELEVADEGAGFDIAAERTTPESEGWFEGERGRGLFIISALTARVESLRTPAGGVVRVTLKPS